MLIGRRRLLTLGANVAASAGLAYALRPARVHARAPDKTLIIIHLRGGADGLSMLVPYADPTYYRARKLTAIAAPGGGPHAAIDLDRRFGLHPRLAPLGSWFMNAELAVWPAVGWARPEHSHGRAERRLRETLTGLLPAERVLRLGEGRPNLPGAPLHAQLEHVLRQIEAGRAPALAWTELQGWDTHVAQGGAADGGRLAERLAYLSGTLQAVRTRLANRWQSVAVAIVTEFGRSLLENETAGTDDGHASTLWLAGGALRGGGRVLGDWPQLMDAPGIAATADMTQLMRQLVEAYAGNA